ncbi:TPA: hypothetical protein ACW6D3_002702 [Legionella pneumophila]|uniref:hypothetical protein n=1 Tax=Legionella pneumophila TaxID=446 RepID=UPI000A654EC6|nr:hypothetical protein [Legionella pneumophila]HCC3243596.1 hypothetical protein [Legionella pneumophila subsp. pneumophila]MCZ4683294.1 hypothetical protein [Legionella pneumophila]HDV5789934.1 hypothetical protein [Legionella pneumophila]HDV5798917.1 hypothetical protein [Legionella pneumophila]HDV5948482.1 hypothetical protein [Legionella pneumophila]
MPTRRLFKGFIGVIALLSSTLLFTSCTPSTTTNNSHQISHTYEGHNTGGIGWH